MRERKIFFRKLKDVLVMLASIGVACLALAMVGWILYTIIYYGGKSISWSFFTEPTKPYGIPNGGIANAAIGTLMITLGAVVIGVLPGLLGGIYLSEFGRGTKLADSIRFAANVMMGVPSIIVGLFTYAVIVYNTKQFSGWSGSIALAIIMFPIVLRTTEDMMLMVPDTLREAGLALGAPRWKVTLQIICRSARTGLLTGILLAVARVSGETAPLIFTALSSDSWPWHYFTQPTANLTITINEYAMNSPFEEMHSRAWGAALLITLAVLSLNIVSRLIFREEKHGK
jgi:phosphate transport system permease protein